MTPPLLLGLDVGGTKLAAGVAGPSGELRSFVTAASRVEEGPDAVIERLVDLGRRAVATAAPGTEWEAVGAIGIGCGGPLDAESGIVHDPPNLPGWTDLPLAARVSAALGRPAFVENDANAAALAEHRFGAGRGVRNLVYLTISTGIGGGVIVEDRLLRGESGNAAEIGHMSVDYDGWACPCGRRGCPEAFASGAAIARRAQAALDAGVPSALAGGSVSAEDVVAAARDGDPVAVRIWQETTAVLGAMVTNVLNGFNPRLVILGGGVTRAGELLLEPLRRTAASQTLGRQGVEAEIVPAALGDAVGVLGGVAVALERSAAAMPGARP